MTWPLLLFVGAILLNVTGICLGWRRPSVLGSYLNAIGAVVAAAFAFALGPTWLAVVATVVLAGTIRLFWLNTRPSL